MFKFKPVFRTSLLGSWNEFQRSQGTCPPTFGQGRTQNILSPQLFVIKNNVVVQVSLLHYCWCKVPCIGKTQIRSQCAWQTAVWFKCTFGSL